MVKLCFFPNIRQFFSRKKMRILWKNIPLCIFFIFLATLHPGTKTHCTVWFETNCITELWVWKRRRSGREDRKIKTLFQSSSLQARLCDKLSVHDLCVQPTNNRLSKWSFLLTSIYIYICMYPLERTGKSWQNDSTRWVVSGRCSPWLS